MCSELTTAGDDDDDDDLRGVTFKKIHQTERQVKIRVFT